VIENYSEESIDTIAKHQWKHSETTGSPQQEAIPTNWGNKKKRKSNFEKTVKRQRNNSQTR
jgi:hypothetical protein